MPLIRILELPGRGPLDILLSENGVIGRDANARFQIEHPTVSRQHAEVHRSGATVVLVDLGSANGTRVNGRALDGPTTLRDGDQLEFGKVEALYYSSSAPTALTPLPSAAPFPAAPRPVTVAIVSSAANALPALSPRVPLERVEDLLSGLVELLSQPCKLPIRADRIGLIFKALLPELTQVGLLDPCGKLLGGSVGRLYAREFYQAISGAVGAHNGTLELTGPALDGLGQQLGITGLPLFVVCLPLDSQSFGGGALYLESDARFFANDVVDTLKLAAKLLGPLLDRAPEDARFLVTNEDYKLAQRIQRTLLKPAPSKAGVGALQIAVQYVPCYAVGGDFYDFVQVNKNEWAFMLGDVSGKGVSASLLMSQIMAGSRTFLAQSDGPGAFLTRMNSWFGEILEPGLFATMAAVFINTEKGNCRLALAGHNPPVLRTKGGKVLELGFDPGSALGAQATLETKEQRFLLGPGDALVLTSDGVEEAELPTGELFGVPRRDAVLARMPGSQNMAIGLREAVFAFMGQERSSDDLTILVIERN